MSLKLTCMRGWSGSGKSTEARRIANQTGAVVVNRDLLRLQLLGTWWTGDRVDEDRVTIAEEAQVNAFLKAGVSVVVDATHLNPSFLRKWARLASRMGAEFEVVDMIEDPEECKRRVYNRWRAESGELARFLDPKVVERQVRQWPCEKWPEIVADPPLVVEPAPEWADRPVAVIYDLDGTAAIHNGRSPYDFSRVSEDLPNHRLRTLLVGLGESLNPEFIALSGRDDTCRDATWKWLQEHNFPCDMLLMRDTENDVGKHGKLPDSFVKYRLYNEYIRDKFDVLAVFDDRLQVVRLWHELGLSVYRVGDPDADF